MKKFYAVSANNCYCFYAFTSKKMRDDAVKSHPVLMDATYKLAHRSVECRIYDANKLPEGRFR